MAESKISEGINATSIVTKYQDVKSQYNKVTFALQELQNLGIIDHVPSIKDII